MKIAKHRNGSLETIKLRALLHIQKFIEEEGGLPGPSSPGSWTPLNQGPRDDGGRMFIQKGSRMNDDEFDEEPF